MAAIGSVWATGSWADPAWAANTWANISPPTPPTTRPIPARLPYSPPQIGQQFGAAEARVQLALIARAIFSPVTRVTVADTIIAATDDFLLCDTRAGDITVTLLPAFQVMWLPVTIKNIGVGTVTISGTIDGSSGGTLAQYEAVTIMSDGADWWLKSRL